ncbi:MBL fold metallo-hydrolase [Desulfonema ishimotonii]|uniref:MBL fold metallo-hydrolase n=1 Tax=Desulfonema ishimotonii TaxID=45657 RepID=A0A401FVW5_9BACT|nr:MBL fold metallo-hydrolase [Desulfonema ishimotonii]GBC61122.1 MBL fold metallo-hydrolase [Desulfonema ishimotonii]
MITLFESDTHKNLMFNDLSSGKMIQANQHVVVNNGEVMLLDPGGHKIHTRLLSGLSSAVQVSNIHHIFFSHQDPDIVAAANAWLMMTDARAYLPTIWTRFVAHFGVDDLSAKRVDTIPDEGMVITVGGDPLKVIPAHFLHSSGNFHVYDPVSKIFYSGDMGASPAAPYDAVEDFDAHIRYMEGFHRRYMPSSRAIRLWANMVRTLDIESLAPQHGAIFNTPALARQFIDWIEALPVGADIMDDVYRIPG